MTTNMFWWMLKIMFLMYPFLHRKYYLFSQNSESSPSESLEFWEAWNLNFILELQGLSFVCVELCLGKLGASRILVLELQGFLSYLDMRLCSPWEIMTLWDSSLELGDRAWGRQTCTLSRRLVARAPRASPPCVARPAVLLCCWQYYLIHRYGTYLPCEM